MAFIEEDEIDRIANRLEDEAPWETVSKVLSHQGWIDVVTTIHATCSGFASSSRSPRKRPQP